MKNKKIFVFFLFLCFFLNEIVVKADSIPMQDPLKKTVYLFDIKEEISPSTWRKTQIAFAKAKDIQAEIIIIHLNTYGGLLEAADSIRTAILNLNIPIYVFIDNNAASAGALISIACDSIYMRRGANIGAATVVNQTGEKMMDKYQSYMRAIMRATAESHGKDTIINGKDTLISWHRDPAIAEAMVDENKNIEGITAAGEILTFTSSEAIKYGYAEAEIENITEILERNNIDNYQIIEYKDSFLDKIIGHLMNPILQSILIMLIVGGIYFELQSPGIGFALLTSIVAAILYFAPLYLEGLAENWELLIFAIGVLLIIVEIFVTPGFGLIGIVGIFAALFGLTMSLVDNIIFDFDLNIWEYLNPIFEKMLQVVVSMLFSIFISILLAPKILQNKAFSFLALNTTQKKEDGYLSVDNNINYMLGKIGVTATKLMPSGKVEIEKELYNCTATFGFIEKDTAVIVIRQEGGQLYVQKVK